MGELVPHIGWTVEAEHAERLALVCSLTNRPAGRLYRGRPGGAEAGATGVSLGRHCLRVVREETELFTLGKAPDKAVCSA